MRKERKHFTPEEKVAILRRHLVDKVPVSELCEELGLRPTVFYRWQKELFENGAAAFSLKSVPSAKWRRSRNGSSSWRRRSRPRTRSWRMKRFCARLADKAELTQRQGQAYIQRSESPRSPEQSLYLGTRAAAEGSPSVRQSAAH